MKFIPWISSSGIEVTGAFHLHMSTRQGFGTNHKLFLRRRKVRVNKQTLLVRIVSPREARRAYWVGLVVGG